MCSLFIITSVIVPCTKPWTYTAIRSAFTPEERFSQTKQTIKSIREYAPTAKIVLIECSVLSDDMSQELKESVDLYVNYIQNMDVQDSVNSSTKGLGEQMQIQYFLAEFHDFLTKENRFIAIYKLSGRYYLTQKFKEPNFYHMYNDIALGIYVGPCHQETVLYRVPLILLDLYQSNVSKSIQMLRQAATGLETIFGSLFPNIYHVETLGVEGLIAIKKNALYCR